MEYSIESYQELKIPVIGPDNADFMYIFSGIAVFSFKGNGAEWNRDTLTVRIPHQFENRIKILKLTANGALNSIANNEHAVNAGWAIDEINAYEDYEEFTPFKHIDVYAKLAVRDIDGYIYRISFQVFALVEEGVIG